jgi:hypothetical protein
VAKNLGEAALMMIISVFLGCVHAANVNNNIERFN